MRGEWKPQWMRKSVFGPVNSFKFIFVGEASRKKNCFELLFRFKMIYWFTCSTRAQFFLTRHCAVGTNIMIPETNIFESEFAICKHIQSLDLIADLNFFQTIVTQMRYMMIDSRIYIIDKLFFFLLPLLVVMICNWTETLPNRYCREEKKRKRDFFWKNQSRLCRIKRLILVFCSFVVNLEWFWFCMPCNSISDVITRWVCIHFF